MSRPSGLRRTRGHDIRTRQTPGTERTTTMRLTPPRANPHWRIRALVSAGVLVGTAGAARPYR
jgi:hypothetical protein